MEELSINVGDRMIERGSGEYMTVLEIGRGEVIYRYDRYKQKKHAVTSYRLLTLFVRDKSQKYKQAYDKLKEAVIRGVSEADMNMIVRRMQEIEEETNM